MPRYGLAYPKQNFVNTVTKELKCDLFEMEYQWPTELPHVMADLGKIQFDFENFSDGLHDNDFGPRELMGIHETMEGIPYWGCCAGGDWEAPVYFIVYFDGENLRGYVPEKGNTYNPKTKTAYGNGDEEEGEAPDFNVGKLLNDIWDRIKVRSK